MFGCSDRFPDEAAKSPGPVYGRESRTIKSYAVMKPEYHPVDEKKQWHKRQSWIGGAPSAHIPVVSKEDKGAVGQYNLNVELTKKRAPQLSIPKAERFQTQRANMTGPGHQRELTACDSPGPKYNVESYHANGGKIKQTSFSLAPSAPPSRTRLPQMSSPRRGHRESWLSCIDRKGVLISTTTPLSIPRPEGDKFQQLTASAHHGKPTSASNIPSSKSTPRHLTGAVFGNASRFGDRHGEEEDRAKMNNQRVQFYSSQHTRENMGEFSPGPIYAPHQPDVAGGRLASPARSRRRDPPPGSPKEDRNPHANVGSRSSWLVGNIQRRNESEVTFMRNTDVPPGPGTYRPPRSTFTTFSHNAKAKCPSACPPVKRMNSAVTVRAPSSSKKESIARPATET